MNKQKGFTLIELLVVIAIIGILSSIVLASLSTARNKGKDAAIQGQLSSARTAAEIYYSNNGNKYRVAAGSAFIACNDTGGVFVDGAGATGSNMKAILDAIASGTNSASYSNMDCGITAAGDAWSIAAKLPGAGTYSCVDSTGAAKGGYTGMTGAALTNAHGGPGGTVCQ